MKVLLGIGGSEDAFRALERVLERTAETGDDLTIAVLDNPASSPSVAAVEERVRDRLAATDVSATVRVLEGDPGGRLVEVADAEGFDRIVLGGGRSSPLGKVTLGSVAEFVLLNSQTSVTLIR